MKGHGSKFGRKKDEAIIALLTQRNVEEAAKSIGIATTTLMNCELSVRLYTGRPVSGAGRRTTPATWNGRGAMGQSPVGWSRLEYAKEPTDRNGGTKG